jgi:hypothetical protein
MSGWQLRLMDGAFWVLYSAFAIAVGYEAARLIGWWIA